MASVERNRAGRIHDPVFIFMVAAMILAVISSIALRTMVSGMGPASAHAAENPNGDDMSPPPSGTPSHLTHRGVK